MKKLDSKQLSNVVDTLPRIRRVSDIFVIRCPKIKNLTPETAEIFLCGKILKNLLKWYSSQEFTEPQIKPVAEVLIDDYDDIKLNEIDYFFKMMAKGEFGQVYGKVDAADILDKFGQYAKMTGEEKTIITERRHANLKGGSMVRSSADKPIKVDYAESMKTFKKMKIKNI